ncbi:hypothetical protein B0H63DRAFT_119764 [Podospora didyma]|uniref:C2H2-type domain-containing protein n=1 Tax=Podospora didyma TaxID=330526 RepID=A0AAE0NZH0_9PEZI|nr:hypothetical protein B0H63DRAFT_119764 [Podospora didyma]
MDSKRMILLEDDSLVSQSGPRPSLSASIRPLSPFRKGRYVVVGDRGHGHATPSHHVDLDPSQAHLSCVTQNTSQEDCARHRFIVWAAVKRNTSQRMKPEERLECPLLRCTQRFTDHESMLRHLAGCNHLPSGEYWCYDHMRVERFDDLKCKRCLGHPSKRKKMLSMAKTFFHSLGHKSKKGNGLGFDGDEAMLLPPPSYDSLGIPPANANATELSSTEIVEIDSVEVHTIHAHAPGLAATLPSSDGAIDPQALLVPSLPELDSTAMSNDSFMQWHPHPHPIVTSSSYPTGLSEDGESRSPSSSKPTLQVTTHGLPARRHAPRPVPRPVPVVSRSKGLSPSSSVRSNASTDTTASTETSASTTSNISSIVSPISSWSGEWSMGDGINTSMTSPIDGFLCDDAFDQAFNTACPDFLHDFYSELPADPPTSKIANDMASDPIFMLDLAPLPDSTYAMDMLSENPTSSTDVNGMETEKADVCCSEAKSIAGSAWDALQEHIVSSMVKIQSVQGNRLADKLRSMSGKTIAIAGFRAVRTLLNGGRPSSASDILCFVHLAYALSLVVHEQGASFRSKNFFLQSLSYTHSLPPSERDSYSQLAFAIWQPSELIQADIDRYFAMLPSKSLSRSSSLKGKSPEIDNGYLEDNDLDSLLIATQNFLDEFESSLILGQPQLSPEIFTSALYMKHHQEVNFAPFSESFYLAVPGVLHSLAKDFADAGDLQNQLGGVYKRVSDGAISTARRFEIELLSTGKACMTATRFFASFVPRTRDLCDKIYEEPGSNFPTRAVYHSLGISLFESLIPEFDNSTGDAAGSILEEHDLDEMFNQITVDNPFSNLATADSTDYNIGNPSCLYTLPIDLQGVEMLSTESTSSSQNPSPVRGQSVQVELSEQQPTGEEKVEADACCDLCGYRPKGDPKWFKGSMSKHKKLQHSEAPPKIYKCPYPGCSSQYKNRPDNLRQHQMEKSHWVQGDDGASRRPSKRKKLAVDEE